jgi:hypothetical protein
MSIVASSTSTPSVSTPTTTRGGSSQGSQTTHSNGMFEFALVGPTTNNESMVTLICSHILFVAGTDQASGQRGRGGNRGRGGRGRGHHDAAAHTGDRSSSRTNGRGRGRSQQQNNPTTSGVVAGGTNDGATGVPSSELPNGNGSHQTIHTFNPNRGGRGGRGRGGNRPVAARRGGAHHSNGSNDEAASLALAMSLSQQEAIPAVAPPPLSAPVVAGVKGNANHLLSFHFAPVATPAARPPIRRQRRAPVSSFNKETFVHANYHFVVSHGDHTASLSDPDTPVDWQHIQLVFFPVETAIAPVCPICLDPPVAAKMTKCGHVVSHFCLCCTHAYAFTYQVMFIISQLMS